MRNAAMIIRPYLFTFGCFEIEPRSARKPNHVGAYGGAQLLLKMHKYRPGGALIQLVPNH